MVRDDLPASEKAFRFLSGRLCLDLVATVGERWRRCFERLEQPGDLARWLVSVGLLATPPPVTEDELAATREVREAIYRLALAAAGRGDAAPRDIVRLNDAAAGADLSPRLDWESGVHHRADDQPTARALTTVARDAVDLLGGPEADRIRECAAPDCALLYVDRSRGANRKWCSMDACGNRRKVAAYRRRVGAD